MKKLLFSAMMLLVLTTFGQQKPLITGTISGSPASEFILLSLYGDNVEVLDTVTAANGTFNYTPRGSVDHGILRIDAGQRNYIDIIYDGKPIDFTTEYYNPVQAMNVEASEENKTWYYFRRQKENFERRLGVLGNALSNYPDDDPFFLTMQDEFMSILDEEEAFFAEIKEGETDSWAKLLLKSDLMPPIPQDLAPQKQLEWLKDHFFDYMDFTDERMLYTDIIPKKVLDYIKLYANRNLPRKELEQHYIKGVDRLMSFVSGKNDDIEEVVINHMIKGFQQLEFQDVLTYIVNQYVLESSCVDEDRKASLEKRIEGFDKMAEGRKIPAFSIKTTKGEVVTEKNASPYRLIMFWASWCPHCLQDMPAIIESLDKVSRDKIEVVLVSVDSEKSEWEAAIANHPEWWKESCDLKGWNGDMANDFYIYATPTMLLLDKDGVILSKPINSGQLDLALEKAGLL